MGEKWRGDPRLIERVRERGGGVGKRERGRNNDVSRTSFELVGADWPGCERRRTAGAWPVDCRGVKSPRFRAEQGSPSLPLSLPA